MNKIATLSLATIVIGSSVACSNTRELEPISNASNTALQPISKEPGTQIDFNFDRPIPVVTRPSPRYILVKNADYALISPWSPSVRGIPLIDAHVAWTDEIVFWVNPELDYQITARHIGRITIPDPSQPNIRYQAETVSFEYDVPLSYENMLDWNLYNKIVWANRYNQFEDTYGISSQQFMEAVRRVEQMFINDGNP